MLKVYWNKEVCGVLSRDKKGRPSFEYTESWLASHSKPISVSMPCTTGPQSKPAVRAFFENLLPENESRERLAFNKRFHKTDTLAFLAHFGEDCAGALSIVSIDKEPDFTKGQYQLIDDELKKVLDLKKKDPENCLVLDSFEEARLSIAGAQDKLPVHYRDGKFYIPKSAASPTSHILKPYNPAFQDLPRNEAFCMDLARKIGLDVPKSELVKFAGHELYMVERFDRKGEGVNLKRIHQEDFCQALAVNVEQKYQDSGGPGYADCYGLAEQHLGNSIVGVKNKFTEAMIFNLIIGNNDAHAKNYSITHPLDNKPKKMSPLYDLVSTEVYPNLVKKTAMSVGKTYRTDRIAQHSFKEYAKDMKVSLSYVTNIAEDILCQIGDNLESTCYFHKNKYGENDIYDKLKKGIEHNSKKLIEDLELDLDTRLVMR